MAFTNTDTVRQHLRQEGAVRDTFADVTVQLLAASPVALLHANLKAGTVRIKGKEIGTPRSENVTLAAQPVALANQQLIPDSVVVASDSSLGTIYTENTDYHVDNVDGKLARIAAGTIGSGTAVAVWYYVYRLYVEGVDFTVNYEKGTIRRITSGAIEDGQTVFVDYQTLAGGFDDAQITNAITEADDLLLKLIDASYQDSADQTLITAETYLALAILCRAKAAAALETTVMSGAAQIAQGWRELADRYDFDGKQLAVRFAGPRPRLNSPTVVIGGMER
jgi:hypothetical protein